MLKKTVSTAALIAALAIPTSVMAATATVMTDLNLRTGPGPDYQVKGTIAQQDSIDVEGCIDNGKWCKVAYKGEEGWAYAPYIAYQMDDKVVILQEARGTVEIPTVDYKGSDGAVVGAAGGVVAGALIAGPIGAAVGGAAGLVAGSTIDPPARVVRYVDSNTRDQVYLDGEVVVGARLPSGVVAYDVPDYEYQYAYINGVRVLVDPQTKAIVHVYR